MDNGIKTNEEFKPWEIILAIAILCLSLLLISATIAGCAVLIRIGF